MGWGGEGSREKEERKSRCVVKDVVSPRLTGLPGKVKEVKQNLRLKRFS